MEIDLHKEYFVPVLANDKGEYTGLRAREHPQLGKVVVLFTTRERLDDYIARSDDNQAFLDILERGPEDIKSEDLNLGYCIRTTAQKLLPRLRTHDVDYLHVDPLDPGGHNRVYTSPHKA